MPSTPSQPSDNATVTVSLPTASPSPHATCPPEENREHSTSRGEEAAAEDRVGLTNGQLPTPEAEHGGDTDGMVTLEPAVKHIEDVEEELMRDSSSPSNIAEDPKDNDVRLAQSMSATALSPSSPPNTPNDLLDRRRVSRTKFLPSLVR